MTVSQLIIVFFIIQIIHGLGTWKLYQKAGRKAWEAFTPVYNALVLMKIINRPWWWVIILFIPIVNQIMFPAVWVETARSFGKNSHVDTFLAIITLGFYNYYLNYVADVQYIENRDLKPKNGVADFLSAALFAIVAATIVHTYMFQPFVIPSSSLEKSLLVGDFLIVSKLHYGPRNPTTTVAMPFMHDTIPGIKTKSYLFSDKFEERNTSWKNKLQLPKLRFPGFEHIERNDIVVFGQPADTLRDMNDFTPDRNYYKPVDKKTNLVKRCVGIPGDSLEVIDGYVYINSKKNVLPDRAELQHNYKVHLKAPLTQSFIRNYNIEISKDKHGQWIMQKIYQMNDSIWNIPKYRNAILEIDALIETNSEKENIVEIASYIDLSKKNLKDLNLKKVSQKYVLNLTEENAEKISKLSGTISVEKYSSKSWNKSVFPHNPRYQWNYDNFGPVYIPKSGDILDLTIENIPIYKRLISEYEGHKVVTRGNQIFIDDQPATSYIVKQDYYWMMGDNRNNSIDARGWGFVPFDHVIGKPVFIWMSLDGINGGPKRIRWDRVFTTVGGDGERRSYLIPFLVFVVGITLFNRWRKKKKANKAA